MAGKLHEVVVFFREFRSTYNSTGALLPSGRQLARALTRFVRDDATGDSDPRRFLEVGPGTGAVTREIIRAMRPNDRLQLVELNDRFVEYLTAKVATDHRFCSAQDRVRIVHAPVQELPSNEKYDLVISGLPFNNFSPELVREIVDKLRELLVPGGTLSFFEYVAIRRVKTVVSSRTERTRLRDIGQLLEGMFDEHEVRRDRVLRNVPPAWVHHLRFEPGEEADGQIGR